MISISILESTVKHPNAYRYENQPYKPIIKEQFYETMPIKTLQCPNTSRLLCLIHQSVSGKEYKDGNAYLAPLPYNLDYIMVSDVNRIIQSSIYIK